jgi:hypothetical protein
MEPQLVLERCPHCSVAKPNLVLQWTTKTASHANRNHRDWAVYRCQTCGGLVMCAGPDGAGLLVTEMYPSVMSVSSDLPERARAYLQQAVETIHAAAGSVMLAASAIDAMLKAKNLTTGSLYDRIDAAAANHLITAEMAAWAHEVRLDANDQRHADTSAQLPGEDDAKKAIAFASALGEFLFVLPARVVRGRKGVTTP